MTDLAATLEWLVNIPSVTGSEGRIATAISERLLPIWTPSGVQRFGIVFDQKDCAHGPVTFALIRPASIGCPAGGRAAAT